MGTLISLLRITQRVVSFSLGVHLSWAWQERAGRGERLGVRTKFLHNQLLAMRWVGLDSGSIRSVYTAPVLADAVRLAIHEAKITP